MKHDLNVHAALAAGALALGAAAWVGAQTAPASPAPAGAQGLAGTWRLNAEESDDFREKMRAARGGQRGGRPGGGGFGGGFGGGRRGGRPGQGGMPGGEGEERPGRESMRRLAEPSEMLTIKLEEGAVLVSDDTGAVRRLHPDGRTSKADNGEAEVRSRWEGDTLVAETVLPRGPGFKESFRLAPDGRRLFVTVHLQPPSGQKVEVRRVYDAAS